MTIYLDSGAVTFLAGRSSGVAAVHNLLKGHGPYVVPSIVLVECLSGRPSDAPIHRFLKACDTLTTISDPLARQAADLRHRAGRGSAVDALLVALAQGGIVVTGDSEDFSALKAHARNVTLITV